jgi:hypothetical protein
MEDPQKIAAVKSYLRRKKTSAEIEAIADEAFEATSEEVTITSQSVTDGTSSGQVTFPKWLLLKACEEILEENSGSGVRVLCSVVRRDGSPSRD